MKHIPALPVQIFSNVVACPPTHIGSTTLGLVAARYEDGGMSPDSDQVRCQFLKVEKLGVNVEERLR